MANQVLAFHRVSDRVFDLSGLRTGSVRDQLLRSTLIAVALGDEGLIDNGPDGGLLVLGAGAAGMNLALSAAARRVNVVVLEREAGPFTTLLKATSRRIDPVEYDWPHAHFRDGKFPASGSTIPLVQMSGAGDDLAFDWMQAWNLWKTYRDGRHGRGKVDLQLGTDARQFKNGIKDLGRAIGVEVTGPFGGAAISTRKFGAVVSCVGFSGEITSDENSTIDRWNGYHGPTFWLDDDSLTPASPQPPVVKRVVISGGGDGGMQDFQRAATGQFGKALLDVVSTAAAAIVPGWNPTPPEALLSFALAEDVGRRAHAWHREKQPIQKALLEWHAVYDREVRTLLQPLATAGKTLALAQAVLRPEVVSGAMDVQWIYRSQTPGYAYALNRYLSLVLRHLLASIPGCQSKIWEDHEIISMAPVAHTCYDPAVCLGQPHNLTVCDPHGVRAPINDVDLVIVRHGARPQRVLNGPAVREQMTPFDFPV